MEVDMSDKVLYEALKVAQIVINELLFNNPKAYKKQQEIIQDAIDTADIGGWYDEVRKGDKVFQGFSFTG